MCVYVNVYVNVCVYMYVCIYENLYMNMYLYKEYDNFRFEICNNNESRGIFILLMTSNQNRTTRKNQVR